jgi:Protein of unknown function (DUF4238)
MLRCGARLIAVRGPHSGTRIDDVEWSLSQLENKAAPVLQTVEERWPLRFEEKLVLAELFGAQLVRGDRWREAYEARSDRLVDHYQRRGDFDQDATGERTRSYSALTMELFPGYGPEAVETSVLRRAVHEKVNSKLGEETNEFEIIRLNAAA